MRSLATALLLVSATVCAQDGGGPLPGGQARDELSAQQRADIDAMIAANIAQLRAERRLLANPLAPAQSGLQWPLRSVAAYRDAGYHGISNFVDLDPAHPNHVLDFNCGTRTYDLASSDHAGIDIYLAPFPWLMMDQQVVDIVAAAPGQIVGKVDGNNDRSCPNNYSADWNAVYVQHGDGSVAWYGHMKLNSQTAKPIGASVAVGEFLGKVGSAGFSTGPHLHFENHSAATGYQILEPFAGTCRAGASLWASQRPYYDTALNKLSTNSAPPSFSVNCPNPGEETPNLKNAFQPGDTVYAVIYVRDETASMNVALSILRPNGTLYDSFSHQGSTYYSSAYWYWTRTLPAGAPSGVWTLRAVLGGVTHDHRFTVGDVIFADGLESG